MSDYVITASVDSKPSGAYCPSTTGLAQPGFKCSVSGDEHHCMGARNVHAIHTCQCGASWMHDSVRAADIRRALDPR